MSRRAGKLAVAQQARLLHCALGASQQRQRSEEDSLICFIELDVP